MSINSSCSRDFDEIMNMVHLGKSAARQFTGHRVIRPQFCARIAVTAMTKPVIVAKAMCFVEGAP